MNPEQFLDFILHVGSYVAVFWYGWWAKGQCDKKSEIDEIEPRG